MRYFSGFCLNTEEGLFEEIIGEYSNNPYVVVGFSYGAIKALEYVYESKKRIERLILLSPSFFIGRPASFLKMQRLYFRKDPAAYIGKFMANAAYPADERVLKPFLSPGTLEELEELLTYEWPEEKFDLIAGRGTKIEVFLGGRDKIIDAKVAHAYFKKLAESYFFKEYGHILQEGEE